jgi:hypothetical protein
MRKKDLFTAFVTILILCTAWMASAQGEEPTIYEDREAGPAEEPPSPEDEVYDTQGDIIQEPEATTIEVKGPIEYTEPHITDLECDALKTCPEGLDCWNIEGKGTLCVDPDPCTWFCEEECAILESYPPQLKCEDISIKHELDEAWLDTKGPQEKESWPVLKRMWEWIKSLFSR